MFPLCSNVSAGQLQGALKRGDNLIVDGRSSSTKAGRPAGAGVEVAFADNWTARLDYLFLDLQSATFNSATIGPVTFDANLVRLGVDYKFR